MIQKNCKYSFLFLNLFRHELVSITFTNHLNGLFYRYKFAFYSQFLVSNLLLLLMQFLRHIVLHFLFFPPKCNHFLSALTKVTFNVQTLLLFNYFAQRISKFSWNTTWCSNWRFEMCRTYNFFNYLKVALIFKMNLSYFFLLT